MIGSSTCPGPRVVPRTGKPYGAGSGWVPLRLHPPKGPEVGPILVAELFIDSRFASRYKSRWSDRPVRFEHNLVTVSLSN